MEYIEKLKTLIQNLEKCELIVKHSNNEENQADTLANTLIDIEESVKKIGELIPKLYSSNLPDSDTEDLILDIGEELRHILYHINDTRVYDYLKH